MLEFSENSSKALHIYAAAQPPVVQTGASGRENEFAHSTPKMYCGKLCGDTSCTNTGGPGRERAMEWYTPPERGAHEHAEQLRGRGTGQGGGLIGIPLP